MKKSIGAKTLLYPAPVLVVGSYDDKGKPNVMTAAWGGICCSKPPCVMVALRKATYSYAGIQENGAFTISIPSTDHAKEADFFGIASGKNTDKFARTGLTPTKGDRVNAPYVAEFPVVLECELRHTFELGLHTQFVGEVMDVKAEDGVLGDDGLPDMEKVRPMLFAPESGHYYGVGGVVGKAFSIGKEIG